MCIDFDHLNTSRKLRYRRLRWFHYFKYKCLKFRVKNRTYLANFADFPKKHKNNEKLHVLIL